MRFWQQKKKKEERKGYRWRRAVLRRRKGCKLLSRDKLDRRLRMMDVMKMGKLERVLMEKRVTMKMEIAEEELVVERKDWGQEELSRPEKKYLNC